MISSLDCISYCSMKGSDEIREKGSSMGGEKDLIREVIDDIDDDVMVLRFLLLLRDEAFRKAMEKILDASPSLRDALVKAALHPVDSSILPLNDDSQIMS
ncbi:MAG: hypothetical protein AAF603_00825 [Pseudomonadota bacterium]